MFQFNKGGIMNRCFPTYLLLLVLAILSFHLYLFSHQNGLSGGPAPQARSSTTAESPNYSAVQPHNLGQQMAR